MKPSFQQKRQRRAGLTLVEVMVSATLLSIMLLGLFALNSTCRRFVQAQRETALSSYTVEHAIENLRARNWGVISSPAGVQSWLQNLTCDGISQLQDPRMKVSVYPYPPLTPEPTPIVVTKSGNATTIVSQPPAGLSLRSLTAVRVDFQITWRSATNKKDRMREISSVVSLSGLLK